jgi:hypothetical protein
MNLNKWEVYRRETFKAAWDLAYQTHSVSIETAKKFGKLKVIPPVIPTIRKSVFLKSKVQKS